MIRTFVFFDLETTGLIQGNFIPNITELALVAVTRNNLLDTVDDSPRVLHKLLLPVRPKLKIPKMVEIFTNLTNENLKEAQCFDEGKYDLIKSFLNQLSEPICFVAHNGIKFDYPILLNEVQCVNKTFRDNILCIDTLHLFKDFYTQNVQLEKDINIAQAGTNFPTSFAEKGFYSLLNDGLDNELEAALDSVMSKNDVQKTDILSKSKNPEQISYAEYNKQQPANSGGCNVKTPSSRHCQSMQATNEKTPEGQMIKLHKTHPMQRKGKHVVKRKLNFTDSKPPNFKLGTIYTHMLGSTAKELHTAEGDCLSMLYCVVKIATFFVEWADHNAVPLVNFKKQ